MSDIPIEYLRECFDYYPHTGELVWRERPRHHFKYDGTHRNMNKKMAGKVIRTCNSLGYYKVKVSYQGKPKHLSIHRIAMAMTKGRWTPKGMEIDHRNGIRNDNRLDNLREVTVSDNQLNRRKPSKSNTGYKGVYQTRHGKFQVLITHANLGRYESMQEAIKARNDYIIPKGFTLTEDGKGYYQ